MQKLSLPVFNKISQYVLHLLCIIIFHGVAMGMQSALSLLATKVTSFLPKRTPNIVGGHGLNLIFAVDKALIQN